MRAFSHLGCVIRGETDHYDHICREVSRKLMDLSVDYAMPHGFGILTCENKDQAWERADTAQRNLGGRTAEACLRMIDIKSGFPNRPSEHFGQFDEQNHKKKQIEQVQRDWPVFKVSTKWK